MGRVFATTIVPGRIVEAEELWYDPQRWPAWIDGFGHVAKLEGEWPKEGARLLWDSPPQGRGRVDERVTAYEARTGHTLAVEDAKLRGTQTVAFEVAGGDEVRVTLSLEYELQAAQPADAAARPAVHPPRPARVAAAHESCASATSGRRGDRADHRILTGRAARSGRAPGHRRRTADHRRRGRRPRSRQRAGGELRSAPSARRRAPSGRRRRRGRCA